MKLLYSGEKDCSNITFKRMLILANEIAFIDRPAVNYGNWGMVGSDSILRRLKVEPNDPIKISVHEAPAGYPSDLILKYLEKDVSNFSFRSIFLDGLSDTNFTSKFISQDAKYKAGSKEYRGIEIINALIEDKSLREGVLEPLYSPPDPDSMYEINSSSKRRAILARELMTASINVTTSILISEQTGAIPITNEPYFAKLIALRSSNQNYIGNTSVNVPLIGMEIVRAVIPDEALERLSIKDIYDYRDKTRDIFENWSSELNSIGALLDDMTPDNLILELPRLIATKIQPNIVEYQNEMRLVRDKLFSSLLKDLVKWDLPAISLATFSNLNLATSILAFTVLLKGTVPHLVDYYYGRKDIGRKHAVSYVLGLSKNLERK